MITCENLFIANSSQIEAAANGQPECLACCWLDLPRNCALFLGPKDLSALFGVQAIAELPIKTLHVVVAAFLVLPALRAHRALQDQSCIRRHSRDLLVYRK